MRPAPLIEVRCAHVPCSPDIGQMGACTLLPCWSIAPLHEYCSPAGGHMCACTLFSYWRSDGSMRTAASLDGSVSTAPLTEVRWELS
jgi:hypothetical protein